MKRATTPLLAFLLATPLASCGPSGPVVVVYTSVDRVFAEPVLKAFERKSGTTVNAVYDTEEAKSAGIVNRLLAEKDHPRADVFWSGDPVRAQVLADRGALEAYRSPAASDLPSAFSSPDGLWTGFSARARVFLVNSDQVAAGEEPRSVFDLLDSKWRDRAAMANPLFGTTSFHVAALFVRYGDARGQGFLDGVRANGVRIVSSNGEVRKLVSDGAVAWGLLDTDDAAEAFHDGKRVSIVFPDQAGDGALLVPNATCLIRGAPHPEAGRGLIDYLLDARTEETLALAGCAQLPLRAGLAPPELFASAEPRRWLTVDLGAAARKLAEIEPVLRRFAGA